MKKNQVNINKKENYAPDLPEEELGKLREELSNPNLIPQPYLFNSGSQDSSDKFKKIINELVADYNRKIVNIVEEEKKIAFEAGRQEERKIHAKN